VRSIEIKRQIDGKTMEEVSALISDAWRADGARPLNDHLWLDLREGGRSGFAGVISRDLDHEHLLGYCQVSRGNESWSLDLIVHPHHRYDSMEIAPELLKAALDIVSSEGGGHVHWWVFEPNNIHRQLAKEAGLTTGRQLLQMRRSLPLPGELADTVRDFTVDSFITGVDEDAWLGVNNAAFSSHPEQGGWTTDIIESRINEEWFDPQGLLMHWENEKLLGFCWTKIHADTDPPMGEIYVVAVDPKIAGRGLGKRLTIAGLNYMAAKGISTAMLYVDNDNHAAISVYRSLGFIAHHSEHAFVGDIASV
jgi:mycothiol synthase